MATAPDHGILERQAGHPMATACVIVSFCALLGAIAFNLCEIGELRAGKHGKDLKPDATQKADVKRFHDDVQKEILELQKVDAELLGALPPEGAATPPAEGAETEEGKAAPAEEPKAESGDEPKAEPAEAPAEPEPKEEPKAEDASETK